MSDDDFNMEDFQGEEGLIGIAKMGLTIFRALKRDGATDSEAFAVTSAFFAGMTKATYTDNED